MAEWEQRIGQFARAQRQDDGDVDKELHEMATSGAYGYEQQGGDNSTCKKRAGIYQSYDQGQETTLTTLVEVSEPLSAVVY